MSIRVIAAVVDTKQLRLYKEDGSTVDIPQGDERLAQLLEQCKPLSNPKAFRLPLNTAGTPYVEVDFHPIDKVRENPYGDYEKKAGGLTKFFRVVKSKVMHLFGDGQVVEPIAPVSMGRVPEAPLELNQEAEAAPAPEPVPATPKIDNAIADIMAHAEPVSNETFDDDDTTKEHTIIAVTTTTEGKAVIVPGVESLKNHMVHAAKVGNTKGMETFLQRLGKAITQRDHSVNDVLRFMERGDLPLADDGCIIAYKVLRSTKKTDNSPLAQGTFVDCHSGKVEQRVGSYVHQAISLIRQDKQQCGTGLHIARRAYLGSFSGDIIVMVKIRPEDVIVVPNGEPDKMRVAGYHIIAKIPKDEHGKLRSNTAMTGTNALKLLTQAIAGEHIGIIETVEITAAFGGSFTVTPVEAQQKHQPSIKRDTAITPAVAPVVKKEAALLTAEPVDPKATAKEIETVKKLTVAEYARELFTTGKLQELKAYKKKAKKGWDKLGFTAAEEELILSSDVPVTNGQPSPGKMTKAEQAKQEEAVSAITPLVEAAKEAEKLNEPIEVKDAHPSTPHVPNAKTVKALNEAEAMRSKPKMEGTRAEVARKLFERATATGEFAGKPVEKQAWTHLWLHRKECKKGWDLLGFTPKEIERIKANKPDHV